MKRLAMVVCACPVFAWAQALPSTPDPNLCSAQQPDKCLNGVSSSVTALDALRVTELVPPARREEEKKKKGAGIARIRLAAAEGASGLLGGLGAGGWAAWASIGRADFKGSVPVAPYDAELKTFRFGIDRLFQDRYVLGAALVFDRLDTRTRFNGGGQDADTWTIVPYFTMILNDWASVDLNAGWGRLDSRQNRIDPASVPGAPQILTASFNGDRRFGSATLNLFRYTGNWTLGGRAGYLVSREDQDAYREVGGPSARSVRERNLKLDQLYAGADAAYRLPNNLEFYGSAIYRRDTGRNDGSDAGGLPSAVGSTLPPDRTEVEWAFGARFFGAKGLTLSAEYLKTSGRDQFKHHAVNLIVRIEL